MKTHFFSILFSFLTISAFATNFPTIRVESEKTVIVSTEGWKSDFVTITIKSESGNIVKKEEIATTFIGKKYNLKFLPVGKYTLTVENSLKSSSADFSINDTTIVFESENYDVYKPQVTSEGKFVKINYLSLNKSVDVRIENKDGNTIYSDNFKESSINKMLNLSKLPSDTYYVYISTNNEVYLNAVNLK